MPVTIPLLFCVTIQDWGVGWRTFFVDVIVSLTSIPIAKYIIEFLI